MYWRPQQIAKAMRSARGAWNAPFLHGILVWTGPKWEDFQCVENSNLVVMATTVPMEKFSLCSCSSGSSEFWIPLTFVLGGIGEQHNVWISLTGTQTAMKRWLQIFKKKWFAFSYTLTIVLSYCLLHFLLCIFYYTVLLFLNMITDFSTCDLGVKANLSTHKENNEWWINRNIFYLIYKRKDFQFNMNLLSLFGRRMCKVPLATATHQNAYPHQAGRS